MPAVKTHTEELRAALVDEAGRVLRTDGPGAVTLRRIAQATGTSTTAVYTLFGDKAGLVEEMYVEGFRRLIRAVTALPVTDDPVHDLVAIGNAYRRAALRSPHLYELMFGRPVPGYTPSPQATAIARRAFQPVVVAVRRAADRGAFVPGTDPEGVAYHLWALAHGLVMFEVHRALPLKRAEYERRYSAAVEATLAAYVSGRPVAAAT